MRTILKNIKTTLAGSFAGLPLIIQGIQEKNIILIVSGAATFILGLISKDAE